MTANTAAQQPMGTDGGAGESDVVLLSTDGPVATMTLNRPERKNAINADMWLGLDRALARLQRDPSVRALVLTGAGGSFSSGADISESRTTDVHPLDFMHRINDVALNLHNFAKPTIAKVEGVAVGAGWNLALGCDLVVASNTARFSQIFVRRALSVDFGGSWLLPRLVGLQTAKRLALLGDFISAEEAHCLGLVTWVTEPADLDAFVAELAGRLAAGPPVAMAQTKALLNRGSQSDLADALNAEAHAQVVNMATADTRLAAEAFAKRQDTTFTGRWMTPSPHP